MNSDFEDQLRRQPMREIPPHWRGRILVTAQSESQAPWWQRWFAPWPKAWGALAAAWVAIFFFYSTTPDKPVWEQTASSGAAPSYAALQQEKALMAQLLNSPDGAEASPALPAKPQPRSEGPLRQRIG